MDNRNIYFIVGGISAFLFYALLLILFFFYFNEYRSTKRFVPQKSESLEVSILQIPSQSQKPKKNISSVKKIEKQTLKSKKSRSRGVTSPKYSNPSNKIATLFKGVKVGKPESVISMSMSNAPKIKYKRVKSSKREEFEAKSLVENLKFDNLDIKLKSKSSGIGEIDAYISKIYKVIYDSWTPDELFVGLEAKVAVEIEPDGTFQFRMVTPSDNQSFNNSLIEYLNQLKQKGFPPHNRGRKLIVELDFKPKE